MKNIGFSEVITKEGLEPMRIFGEKKEILPKGFKLPVAVFVYRMSAPSSQFQVSHFPTGLLLFRGMNKNVAILNVAKWLEEFTEPAFEKLLLDKAVINTEIQIPNHEEKK